MKIVLKIFIILNIITACIFLFNVPCTQVKAFSEIFDSADDFLKAGEPNDVMTSESIEKMSDTLYTIVFVIGIALAVIIGIIIGIKFVTGGVEQKAKIKETLIPYIAGCVVILGAFTIWKLVVTILQSME